MQRYTNYHKCESIDHRHIILYAAYGINIAQHASEGMIFQQPRLNTFYDSFSVKCNNLESYSPTLQSKNDLSPGPDFLRMGFGPNLYTHIRYKGETGKPWGRTPFLAIFFGALRLSTPARESLEFSEYPVTQMEKCLIHRLTNGSRVSMSFILFPLRFRFVRFGHSFNAPSPVDSLLSLSSNCKNNTDWYHVMFQKSKVYLSLCVEQVQMSQNKMMRSSCQITDQ